MVQGVSQVCETAEREKERELADKMGIYTEFPTMRCNVRRRKKSAEEKVAFLKGSKVVFNIPQQRNLR